MKIGHETTLSDLAFIVCSELEAYGITAVLSGGGAATVYAPDAYQSRDLDFILQYVAATFPPDDLPLRNLGFSAWNSIYRHPETPFTVEFPSGPLEIGSEVITK